MNKARLLILLLLLALLLAVPVLAQISVHYDLGWHVLSGGGGSRGSTNYQVDDVLGQWPDGRTESAHYQIDPGFWHAGHVQKYSYLHLPAIFKTQH